jgi:hypothetical protein
LGRVSEWAHRAIFNVLPVSGAGLVLCMLHTSM